LQRLEVSGAVRPIYGSLGVKRLITLRCSLWSQRNNFFEIFIPKFLEQEETVIIADRISPHKLEIYVPCKRAVTLSVLSSLQGLETVVTDGEVCT
jgi:hypothetical protein